MKQALQNKNYNYKLYYMNAIERRYMTKFFIVDITSIHLYKTTNYIIIPFNFSIYLMQYYTWLVNLNNNEYTEKELYETNNYQKWYHRDTNKEMHEFLKSKHTFIKTGIFYIGDEKGINIFEFNEYDLMYMKLMGWVE